MIFHEVGDWLGREHQEKNLEFAAVYSEMIRAALTDHCETVLIEE